MTAYPPPDATREQVEAWKAGKGKKRPPRCRCGHSVASHDAVGSVRCLAFRCGCMGFEPKQPRKSIANRIVAEAVNEGRVKAILRDASKKGRP